MDKKYLQEKQFSNSQFGICISKMSLFLDQFTQGNF